LGNEMPTAVLLPAVFGVIGAERLFLTVADGLDCVGTDSALDQSSLDRIGAVVAQANVVLGGTALVSGSLNRVVDAGMLLQEVDIALQHSLLVAADIGLVVIEVNILHVLREKLLFCRRWRRRRRRWWSGHGNARRGGLRSTRTLRGQGIRG